MLAGVLLLIPLAWFAASRVVPLPLRLVAAAVWGLAAARPRAGLLALAVVAPFGSALMTVFGAAPIQYTEALVLAALSGICIAAALERRGDAEAITPSLGRPAALFAGVVVASLTVALGVGEVGLESRRLFHESFATFLAREYLVGGAGQWPSLAAALPLVEGVALMFVVARWARRTANLSRQMVAAIVAAAGAAAFANVVALAASLGGVDSMRTLVARLLTSRISVHIPDVNAAGSYFAMAGFLAIGLRADASRGSWPERIWAGVAVVIFAALWLTGSRTAVVCTIVLVVAAAVVQRERWRSRPLWTFGAAAVVALLAAAFIVGFDPRAVAGRDLQHTVESRAGFLVTGLRMMASAPVFGVGIGRYLEMSGRFMPESIYWFFFHENAHNNFLQVGGELGLVGLAAFVWLIAAAAVRLRRGAAASRDRVLVGAAAGLATFVATWLTGHPLLVPEVAVPFWILAGAAIARADAHRPPAPAPARGSRAAVATALIALAVSVPLRTDREAAGLNLAEQTFGFYEWEGPAGTPRTRWASPSAAFFVPPSTAEVDIPLHTLFSSRRSTPPVVSIAIGGRVFDRLTLTSDAWTTVRLRLPPGDHREWRRIDIVTQPPWSPAELLGGRDSRVLGVQLRDVTAR